MKKKLEWLGGIAHSPYEAPISIQNTKLKTSVSIGEAKKISGKCALRIEKKGRGGNPVIILYQFSDPEAKNSASLKKLCSELKTKLACGGTIENHEILLTLQDIDKVKKILKTFSILP